MISIRRKLPVKAFKDNKVLLNKVVPRSKRPYKHNTFLYKGGEYGIFNHIYFLLYCSLFNL